MAVFRDDADRRTFAAMIDRHLYSSARRDVHHRVYVNLREEVRLNARNLLTTHFHLILWQKVPGGMARLMRRVIHAYTRYFRTKYGGEGAIFRERFRARRLESPQRFKWCVYYVHSNHKRLGLEWEHSTHRYFEDAGDAPEWLDVESTLRIFGGLPAYRDYLKRCSERSDLDAELRYKTRQT